MNEPGLFAPTSVENVGILLQEFYSICRNPDKDKLHILFFAVRLGIAGLLTENMTRETMCSIISNYLRVLDK